MLIIASFRSYIWYRLLALLLSTPEKILFVCWEEDRSLNPEDSSEWPVRYRCDPFETLEDLQYHQRTHIGHQAFKLNSLPEEVRRMVYEEVWSGLDQINPRYRFSLLLTRRSTYAESFLVLWESV